MPSFALRTNIPANQTVANILTGSAFEFASRDEKVAIAQVQEHNGTPFTNRPQDILSTVQFGSDVQLESGATMIEATLGGGPLIPQNVVVDDVAAAGDRLVIRVENTTAAAIDVSTIVRILPL